jgi:hypothetical protein
VPPISFANSRLKLAGYLVLAIVFVGNGAFIWRVTHTTIEHLVAAACVLLFGIAAVVLARRIFETRPRITLDDTGLCDRTLGVGTIPWSEITDAQIVTVGNVQMISLTVRDPQRWTQQYNPTQQVLAKLNRSLGFAELNLATADLNVKASDLLALIRQRMQIDTGSIDRKYQDNRTF